VIVYGIDMFLLLIPTIPNPPSLPTVVEQVEEILPAISPKKETPSTPEVSKPKEAVKEVREKIRKTVRETRRNIVNEVVKETPKPAVPKEEVTDALVPPQNPLPVPTPTPSPAPEPILEPATPQQPVTPISETPPVTPISETPIVQDALVPVEVPSQPIQPTEVGADEPTPTPPAVTTPSITTEPTPTPVSHNNSQSSSVTFVVPTTPLEPKKEQEKEKATTTPILSSTEEKTPLAPASKPTITAQEAPLPEAKVEKSTTPMMGTIDTDIAFQNRTETLTEYSGYAFKPLEKSTTRTLLGSAFAFFLVGFGTITGFFQDVTRRIKRGSEAFQYSQKNLTPTD
jgi:hypothetical protein